MNQAVKLDIIEPLYGTYHMQGNGCAIIKNNPSIQNWYLNQAITLFCDNKFLQGYTSPELQIRGSQFFENPYLDRKYFHIKDLKSATNTVIRNLLDNGYYVGFDGIDDYYVRGKSWYHKRHFYHDGLICGYDQSKKTFDIFAYDTAWVYRVFETSQAGFTKGRKAEMKKGLYGTLIGLKPTSQEVLLSPSEIYSNLKDYLDSSFDKYPPCKTAIVYGTVVHDYLAMYLDKLGNKSIPHERMDKRIFRLIWEHKKVMHKRLEAVEDELKLDRSTSKQYQKLVEAADEMRLLYAAHHMRNRPALLPVIKKKLLALKKEETALLTEFTLKMKGALQQ